MLRSLCVGAIALFGLMSSSVATTLYSINWVSDPRPCLSSIESVLQGPLISSYYSRCVIGDKAVSICPGQTISGSNSNQPWDRAKSITVIGYQVSMILSSPTAQGIIQVGSWSLSSGADVFATTSGIGTATAKDWLPSGTGIPQGGKGAHFDIYASCGGPGTYSAFVTIFYTSP